jgi:hypothetical protein
LIPTAFVLTGAVIAAGSPPDSVDWVLRMVAWVVGSGLVGWVLARFARLGSRLLDASAAGAEATARLADGTERLIEILERTVVAGVPASPPAPSSPPRPDGFTAAPQPDAATLRARLEAAREAHDPQRVLEIRETLVAVLEPEHRDPLDRSLARWFMALIQKRLRQGAISPEVVVLATQVAAALDTTPEGASLRAALPTLRRSVGLCPRCGKHYAGLADACPACVTAGFTTVSGTPPQDDESPDATNGSPTETGAAEPE